LVKVIKRDCTEVDFQKEKISNAILKAMKNGSGIVKPKIAEDIANEIYEENKDKEEITISEIEGIVYDKLISKKQRLTAKAYEGYRSVREFQRENDNTTDEQIAELLDGSSDYWNNENSNKNPRVAHVQRDYMAGILSTDITRRYLLSPEIVQAHDEGIIHFHDADYFAQKAIHNCFSSNTEFVTSNGLRKFSDFSDGDNVVVLDKDGCWREATVHQYGKQEMFDVTFKSGRREKIVTCTSNHRWILKNGEVTTNLKVGDSLIGLVDSTNLNNPTTYDECNMFSIGFLIGDGCDHDNSHQIRLCGRKNKYAPYFKKAGYRLEKIKDSDDYIAYKKGSLKQDFLNSKAWKHMDLVSRRMLFYGLYCADGDVKRNRLCTTDDRVAEFIRDNCYSAGYHLTSEFVEHRDTNYKKDSELINFLFSKSQPINQLWKVSDIKPHYDYRYEKRNNQKEKNAPVNAWCVEEPITHSFTLSNGMVTGNCELINLEDCLQNGTVINGVQIDKPHRLITATTIATQIITAVTSSSYGGATINLTHLAPFVRDSYNRHLQKYKNRNHTEEDCIKYAKEDLAKEVSDSVQTFNYQCNSMTNTNGQSPFLSVFMYLNDTEEYKEELAMLIEEFLKQRIQGLKNTVGVYVTQAFPKLLYVLEEDNITETGKYWYLTQLAAKCTAKRLVPDYISEKIMLETKIDKNGNGNVYGCMGCRSFLTPYVDENNKPKYWGRFNQGVVTVNLPDIALSSECDFEKFWEIFEERTELCHKALQIRHERLEGTSSDVAPILWKYGALARLEDNEPIDKLLHNGYSTLSLGYAGLYECVKYMTGKSHSDGGLGEIFGLKVMQALNDKCNQWKEAENIDYSLYGTPMESGTYKFAKSLKKRFGDDIFVKLDGEDRNYITNSYHIPVFEEIDPFEKLSIESKFQRLSPGGAISYIECCDLSNNLEAELEVFKFIYNNIMYAELNTKSDYCQVCGYDGEIKIVDEDNQLVWECPNCKNRDKTKMNVARRTCGYIGTQFWNQGRTDEIRHRYVHLDNHELKESD
jgi:ribonucleoside-triphosphate reductase